MPLTLKLILGLSFFLNETRHDIHFGGGAFINRNIIDDLFRPDDGYNPAKGMVHAHHRFDEWAIKRALMRGDGGVAIFVKLRECMAEFAKPNYHPLDMRHHRPSFFE